MTVKNATYKARMRLLPAVLVLTAAGACALAERPNFVYYQVTYEDGTVRDLPDAPETDEGIRMVVRIARYEGPDRGYRVLGTGRSLTLVDRGRTERHQLVWEDGGWVAPEHIEDNRRERLDQQRRTDRPPEADTARIARLREQLQLLTDLQRRLERDISEAEDAFVAAKDTDDEQAARAELRQAIAEDIRLEREIRLLRQQLMLLIDGPAELPEPAGDLEPYSPGEETRPDLGVVTQIEESGPPPHRVRVWKVPEGRGRRRLRVASAHPEAGAFGAVVYVAYADTSGDGVPDRFIGRSPVAAADAPGKWTSWAFETDQPRVYVGCASVGTDGTAYFRPTRPREDNWIGADADVFISDGIEFIPRWRSDPFLSNVRIHVLTERE